AAPDPVNYMGTGRHAGGYLGVSSDEDARQAEEERIKDLVVIEMVLKIPKQDVIDLTVQLVPKSQNASTLFEWGYQKKRGSETLTVADGAGYAATQGNESQPGFDLQDKVYMSKWSNVYRKEELGSSVDLIVRFRASDTRTSKGDVLTLEFEDSKVGGDASI
uniref:hypothetical protein n=1 Tax=Salinicola sp. CPA57 TaxID=1949080 RepID=UPI0013007FF7